jgi:hypothetical protein
MDAEVAIQRIEEIVNLPDAAALRAATREGDALSAALTQAGATDGSDPAAQESEAWESVLFLLQEAGKGGDDEEGPEETLQRARMYAGNILTSGPNWQSQVDVREDDWS